MNTIGDGSPVGAAVPEVPTYVSEDTEAVYEAMLQEGYRNVDEYVKARNAIRSDAVTMKQWMAMRRGVTNRVRKQLNLISKYSPH